MQRLNYVCMLLLAFSLNTVFAGNLYIWVDKDGVKHFSQTPPVEQIKQASIRKGTFNQHDHYALEPEKVSFSSTGNNCEAEPEEGWDKAALKDINEYYDYRVQKCKLMYEQDPSVMEGCQKEQSDIKSRKMKSYDLAIKNRCKN